MIADPVIFKASDVLKQRGILEIASQYGWIEQAAYWRYPIYSLDETIIAYRLKRYPNGQGAKYLWDGTKPTNPDSDWYILPKTKEAIAKAGGVAFLANGEPSLLAYHAGGVLNSLSTTLSEIAVPKNTESILKALGVTRLLYPVDKDKAGHDSAMKWRDALRGTGIDFEALELPDYLQDKGDANDLWIYHHFDKVAFKTALNGLNALILPVLEPLPAKPLEITETPQGLIELLISALGATGFNRNGWSKNFNCPHHEDVHPSAGINKTSGVVMCQVCGSHSPKETADKLGIDWQRFYPSHEKPKQRPRPQARQEFVDYASTEEIPFTYEMTTPEMYVRTALPAGQYDSFIAQDELPLSWIRTMLHLSHSKSATVIQLIQIHKAIRAGRLNPLGFTMKELLALFPDANRKSLQSTLTIAIQWGFFRILGTIVFKETIVETKSGKNLGGRPETYYAISTDTDGIAYNLLELLEPYLLERLTGDEIAPLLPSLRDSLRLERKTWKILQSKETMDKGRLIQEIIAHWTEYVLEDRHSVCFDEQDLESPQALRVRLLRDFLSAYPDGLQIAKHKIAMMLGCSESSLSSLYKVAGVGVKRMKGFYEIERPNGCDIDVEMEKAPHSLNPKLGGISIAIKAKMATGKYTSLIYADKAKDFIDKNMGYLDRVWVWVEQPSLIWLLSEEEKADKAKQDAEKVEQEAQEETVTKPSQEIIEKDDTEMPTPKPSKKRKQSFVSYKDRVSKDHSPEWKRRQAALYVHCFTPYRLDGLNIVFEDETMATCKDLKEVFEFIAERGFDKQIRTAETFDYPEREKEIVIPF